MEADLSYWRFIEEWHPKYWIAKDFNSNEEIVHELKRLEKDLFSESLNNYYERLLA